MNKPFLFKSNVVLKKQISENTLLVTLKCLKPPSIQFKEGQFINIKVNSNTYRPYSLITKPGENAEVSFIVENRHVGIGSNYINSLKIDSEVEFIGPSGKFNLTLPYSQNLYFFATGCGIAPFVSMLHKLIEDRYEGNIVMFYGIKHVNECVFNNLVLPLLNKFENATYYKYLSKDQHDEFRDGRITQELKNDFPIDSHFYICGNPSMSEEIFNSLKEKGILSANIFTERYFKSNGQ